MKKMDSFSGEVPHNKQTNPQPQITFISQSAWSSFHTVNFERLQL